MSDKDLPVGWDEFLITPSDEAIDELKHAWSWLLEEQYQPVLFTALGDMFLETASEEIFWLDTGAGEVSRVSSDIEEFKKLLGTEIAEEWFLPGFISELIAAGKVLQTDQCYSFVILPIFNEGTYTVGNLNPISI